MFEVNLFFGWGSTFVRFRNWILNQLSNLVVHDKLFPFNPTRGMGRLDLCNGLLGQPDGHTVDVVPRLCCHCIDITVSILYWIERWPDNTWIDCSHIVVWKTQVIILVLLILHLLMSPYLVQYDLSHCVIAVGWIECSLAWSRKLPYKRLEDVRHYFDSLDFDDFII